MDKDPPEHLPLATKAQKYLLDYLGLDMNSPKIRKGLVKGNVNTHKDTPLSDPASQQQQQRQIPQPSGSAAS